MFYTSFDAMFKRVQIQKKLKEMYHSSSESEQDIANRFESDKRVEDGTECYDDASKEGGNDIANLSDLNSQTKTVIGGPEIENGFNQVDSSVIEPLQVKDATKEDIGAADAREQAILDIVEMETIYPSLEAILDNDLANQVDCVPKMSLPNKNGKNKGRDSGSEVSQSSEASTEIYSEQSQVSTDSEYATSSESNMKTATVSEDDMAIEKQRLYKFPKLRSAGGAERRLGLYRASIQLGFPLEDCWKIEGFKDYVDFLAKFRDRSDILHNNNCNAVRSFFSMFGGQNVRLTMNLLTSLDNINRYVDFVHSKVAYAPKTRLQKIEALKKAIKWLKMCTFKRDCTYAGPEDRETLMAIMDVLCHECNRLRPYAKAAEGRCSQEASHIASNTYLSMIQFARLGERLLKELEDKHKAIGNYKGSKIDAKLICDKIYEFQQLLLTSMLVLLPTQRSKLYSQAEMGDLSFMKDGASLAVYMEKNSHHRLGIRAAVGRHVFIPKFVAQYLHLWVHRYRRSLVNDKHIMHLFVNRKSKQLMSTVVSMWVKTICRRISGADLTPLSIRRLRTTYFVKAVREMQDAKIEADQVARYAAEVGQSPAILYQYYLIKSEIEQIYASKEVVDKSNEFIFGINRFAGDKIIWDYMRKSEPDKNGDEIDEESDLEQLDATPKIIKSKGWRFRNGNTWGIDDFFNSSKKAAKEPVYRKFLYVDMAGNSGVSKHRHGAQRALKPFPFNFTKVMKQRILSGQWLSDEEMTAALSLLRSQFPGIGGLENTLVLASNQAVKTRHCRNIYIVHDSGNHWVTALYTCDTDEFKIYDCMSRNLATASVIGQLSRVGNKHSKFRVCDFQQQQGYSDCGLYAIAAAVDLACGNDPMNIQYDQSSMRKHLLECFEGKCISVFPRLIGN
jgi:hypothetical protein